MTQGYADDWGSGASANWRTGGASWTTPTQPRTLSVPTNSGWNVNRMGQAAAAITYPGTPPAYGAVVDLAQALGVTSDQFGDFARTMAAATQKPLIELAKRGIPADQHQKELEVAQNFERYGLSMQNSSFKNTDDDNSGFFTQFGNDLLTGFNMAKNTIGQGVHAIGEFTGLDSSTPSNAPSYDAYVAKGGALTEHEWNSFSEATRNELYDRANVSHYAQYVADLPGVKQGLEAVQTGYEGVTAFTDMASKVRRAALLGGEIPTPDSLSMWFDKSEWAKSWRAATDMDSPLSLGNAIVNNLVSPEVSQDTLDEWRKHNAWYSMSSVGAEIAATWNLDLGVQGMKTAGSALRIARREMPLKEHGALYSAIREAQQGREVISVRSAPMKRYAQWQANRTLEGFDGMVDYAKATADNFGTFAQLPAFHGRAADGVAAAKAIHIAANSGDEGLINLTRGALVGDQRALRMIQEMKEDPSLAARYVDGTNFVQAYDAVKLKANQLEDEIQKIETAKASGHSAFGRWELDTDEALKQKEIGEMRRWLDANSDYSDWLASIGTTGQRTTKGVTDVDPFNPQLERFGGAPKTKWNDVEQRFDILTHRRFMPNVFSHHHTKIIVPPSLAAKRVGIVSMHDLDSGQRGINRYFNQLQAVLGYQNDAQRFDVLDRWAKAGSATPYDRYKVMYDMEEEALIPALATKLGISEDTTRVVFNKINEERNRTFQGLTTGKGRMYDTAPTFAQRLADESGATARVTSAVDAKGVPIADENGMVTIEFRDGQRLVTAEVPEGMLAPRVKPVDPTQTANFYQPADVRRLYFEMKRHGDTLAEIDALRPVNALTGVKEFARHDAAQLAEVNEIIGTKFNALWKPLQLWRLGWPQRVLMDEGLRAVAIFGPMYWISGPGAEAVATVARNTPAFIRDKYRAGKVGSVNLADGPLAPQKRAKNAFAFVAEQNHAVRVPADQFPKVNAERLAKMEQVNIAAGRRIAERNKFYALEREAGREVQPEDLLFDHPLKRAISDVYDGVRVYDPTTGKRVSKGYFVPIPGMTHKIETGLPYGDNNLLRWYETNAELLARRGIRVRVNGDTVEIGRWFNSKERGKVHGFMQDVARSKPVGEQTHRGYSLNDNSHIDLTELDTPDPATMLDLNESASRAENDLIRAEAEEPTSMADAWDRFDALIDLPLPKKDFGTGRSRFRSHGRDYLYNDVFEGHLGRLTRGLTSSAPAMDNLTDAHTSALGILRHRAAGHVRIHAPAMTPDALKVGTKAHKKAVLYFQRYADLMNNQVANSPVWGPMLRGASDADVVKYLRENPTGYRHVREVLDPSESVEMYVNEMRAKLDYYLPSHELRRRLAKGPITASDIRRKVHNDDLPDIYGPELTLEDKGVLRAVADHIWNGLGTIPADKFSRQPFAKAVYNQKVRSLINQSDADFLDEAALTRIHEMAARHTREQIRQHLFDLSDGSNLTQALRFVAPFWGAQEEAIMKWAKIISDRPETIARFFAGERAVYNNFAVVDENNQPVPLSRAGGSLFDIGLNYHPNDKVIFPIPNVLRHGPLGKALENIGSIGIPVGSANTILQGDMPLMPAFGPLITIPADKLLNAWSDTHGVEYSQNALYRWLFPIGRPTPGYKGVLEQMFPGWMRRAMSATAPEDDASHASLYMQMAREMTLRNKRLGLAPPTPEEIDKAANLLWGARTAASFLSPVQMEFRPIHQFWSDEAHRYKREYGANWEEKFFHDYKEEAMIYAVSSSIANAGVPPTSEGMQQWSRHQKLIAKYPDLGGLIVGSDSYLGAFNQDAYEAQFKINLGPGNSTALRDTTDPRQRQAAAEESIGWLKFRKIDATVEAELHARGLTNIQQSEAEDIAHWRSDQIAQLMRQYPAWATAWNTSDRTIYQKVEELKDIATRPEFDGRSDIQGLRDYLAVREQVTQELDRAYAQQYASRNLQAQENTALRNWFYNAVGTIIQNNPAFAEVYSRYLSQDTLEQGSGGYG